MNDLISRQAALDFKISHGINECGVLYVPYGEVKKYLEQLPSAQPERKPGHWEIYIISMFEGEGCRCSECGSDGVSYWDFCPSCGADMRGE